jgi:2-iminobutanoate/2-iminopropanoate deaminase
MPKREVKHPDRTAPAGPYSLGVLCDGWLFVGGQTPIDHKTGRIVGTTIEEQTRATLANVDKILQAAGCTRKDVVKCTCHLADMRDFPRFSKTYAEFFDSGVLPVRTTVQSGMDKILVEIDAIARVPE